MNNIFDSTFNGMAHSEFYRAQVVPDVFPDQPRMLIENWPEEEREIWCGIYTPERRAELMAAA